MTRTCRQARLALGLPPRNGGDGAPAPGHGPRPALSGSRVCATQLLCLHGDGVLALVVGRQRHGDLSRLVGQSALAQAAPDERQLTDDDREGSPTGAGVAGAL